jgi:DNA polymerase IV (DinB-like DNA polymerase)
MPHVDCLTVFIDRDDRKKHVITYNGLLFYGEGNLALNVRVVMLMDLDYFFAQAEQVRNPTIKDRPVVVCVYSGRTENSGAVSTANYLAREFGVKSGMPIASAKKKLENVEAVFLPVDHEYYEIVSEKVMAILRAYADSFEQVGIDEAYLDVSRRVNGDYEKARQTAVEIKDEIRKQENLTCSIGVGPNKLIAKIAADAQKPDGLTIIRPEQVTGFLSPLPIDRLIGVGRKTVEKMRPLGIATVGDLAKYDVQRLIEKFGKVSGVYFHNASLGIDDEPVQEKGEIESIGRIATLKVDTLDLTVILEKTNELAKEIHATVMQQGVSFKTVSIMAVMTDMSNRSRSKTLENSTNSSEVLNETVKELFEKFLNESALEIRRVGVKVSSFIKEQKSQKQITSFFDTSKT